MQVLAVITDKSSGMSPQEIREAVKPLETSGVRVITVAVGNEVDSEELKQVSTDGDVVKSKNKENPRDVGKQITDKLGKGVLYHPICKIPFLYLNVGLCWIH